jgi:predicted acylesterase/phospholipase RssA
MRPIALYRYTIGAAVLHLVLLGAGCTSLNEPLNPATRSADLPLAMNHTRAALAADPPPLNANITDDKLRPATQPAATLSPDDGYFVGIGISGGGSRSANFAAACMFHLQRLGLLQRVDYISSVSGGSLTAAYYCVSTDEEWNPGVAQKKLTHSFASDLLWSTFMPWNMVALTFSDYDRSDLLSNSFRKVLFTRNGKELTFADLRPDRPRLLINATDLQSGKGFVFCNETFDRLNSDLGKYPLAHAVAASSAVPVILHQVTLRDHSTTFKQYRHLVDGGVVDNLGVKTLVEMYRAQVKENPGRYHNGAVFIVLDARTEHDARIANRGDTSMLESLQFGAGMTSTVLLNRASTATLAEIILDSSPDSVTAAELRRNRDALINRGYVELEDIDGRRVYVLHLAMSRVDEIADLPSHGFKQSLNNISTYFNIAPSEAAVLYQAANLLVERRFPQELATIADELNGVKRPAATTTASATTQP